MTSKRSSRHAEVKPTKFKTLPCQYYQKGEECPFGTRCTFAHGEHELHSEEVNVLVLRSTGLQRLDSVDAKSAILEHFSIQRPEAVKLSHAGHSHADRPSPYEEECPLRGNTAAAAARSQPQPTAAAADQDATYRSSDTVSTSTGVASPPGRCRCRLRSSCRTGAGLGYSHNPYDMGVLRTVLMSS